MTLTDYPVHSEEFKCPRCGVAIPRHLKGCWFCGEILDKHLTRLYEAERGRKIE